MEVIDFGPLSDDQSAELVGDEDDPWRASEFGLHWRPKDHHVALCDDGGRLVAAAGLVLTEVEIGPRPPIPVVGLGGVIVTASQRGRGFGRQVIAEALRRAEAMGPEIAMLFCRAELAGVYRGHGFAEVREPVLVGQPGGVVELPRGGLAMWRPLRPGARLPDGIVKLTGLPF